MSERASAQRGGGGWRPSLDKDRESPFGPRSPQHSYEVISALPCPSFVAMGLKEVISSPVS